jgi:hypothetical protein
MNNPAVNNETIVKYLLGSLPEAESERLDELSVADDEFAVALSAAEKDLVDAYVQGELTGASLENFRSHYLASPLRRERLDFAQAFGALAESQVNAEDAADAEESASTPPTKRKRTGWFGGKGFFTTPRLAWQWGFAVAAIAFLVAGGWLLSENIRLRREMSETQVRPGVPGTQEQELQNELERQRQAVANTEQELARVRQEREQLEARLKQPVPEPQPAAGQRNTNQQRPSPQGVSIASFILTPQMRGVQQLPTISILPDTDRVSMQLELEPNEYSAYQVALIDQTGAQTFWRSRQLKARATTRGKALSVTLPASLLRSQAYTLRVTGLAVNAGSEVVSDYPFRVVKQ